MNSSTLPTKNNLMRLKENLKLSIQGRELLEKKKIILSMEKTKYQKKEVQQMRLDELQPAEGSKFSAKRVGRGIGSGNGKTAGKGHKGQNARSGGGVRPGFEGGQMPLYRRLPKRGFNNIFAKQYVTINVADLERFEDGTVVTAELLKESGVVSKVLDGIKILGRGELTRKLEVKVAKFSASAAEKIEKAGGKAEVI